MTGRHAAQPYGEWLDSVLAEAIKEFREATGHRPTWSIGRHEKPADPFYPLDKDWRQDWQRRALDVMAAHPEVDP